jgi:excinuclease ABC subunit C
MKKLLIALMTTAAALSLAATAEAAGKLDFERAAHLRDALDALDKTVQPGRRFTRGRGKPLGPGIKPMEDVTDLQAALGLPVPPLLMECFDISNISSTYSVASMVRFQHGKPDGSNYRRYRIKGVEGQNDFASMAEVVRRRYGRILRELKPHSDGENQENVAEGAHRAASSAENTGRPVVHLPDLVIVDGGKGQLAEAVKELNRLGLWDLPVIGLAKEREEIYRPGSEHPLVLPHDRGALKLLQRIRDEAHRFANGYHQILLRKRVRESILDDFPGMSEARKQKLLKHFGSVARLKRHSPEEIAKLPGISVSFARKLADYLAS